MANISPRILRMPALREKVGDVDADTIYNWIKKEGFPKQIKLSERAVGWFEHEVDGWLEQRAAKREQSAAA